MFVLSETNIELIEKEKDKLKKLQEDVLEKWLDNIIEKINSNEASVRIEEIPEQLSSTVQDYIVINYKDYIHSILINMYGDIKLSLGTYDIPSPKYIEDYKLIDIEEGNETLLLELYDYILTSNTNSQLEDFIGDK